MQNDYSNEEILTAIEADFDFHQYPTRFTLARLVEADQWLKEAALAVLASGKFYPDENNAQPNSSTQEI